MQELFSLSGMEYTRLKATAAVEKKNPEGKNQPRAPSPQIPFTI